MSIVRKKNKRKERRAYHVRSRIKRDTTLLRVSVFRSLNQIYAQIIDDAQHATLASCSSLQISAQGTKVEIANAVGLELAKKALQQGIKQVVFDRGSFLYHGRVKSLAEGLRAGGLQL